MINEKGFRSGTAIILLNKQNKVFWAKRCGQNAWQFPQGGLNSDETPEDCMYRELSEETGLIPECVEIIASSRLWLSYRLPANLVRHYTKPICIGQRHKWFLLRLLTDEKYIRFDSTEKPEFDAYKWVDYWFPLKQVIYFKKASYRQALREFEHIVLSYN